jgi:hypothetical protein
MNYIIIFCGLLISKFLSAQSNPILTNQLNLSFGKSKHFSGDIPGIVFTTEYSKNFKKKLSYSIGLTGTIHDREDPLFFTDFSGEEINGSIRYVVAGVQTSFHLGYHFIQTNKNRFQLRFGTLLRYQSSSLPDARTILYEPVTGLPIPLIYFEQYESQRMFMVGGSLQLRYDYTFNKKITIGILGGFQVDSNEDNIAQVSLSVGRRF